MLAQAGLQDEMTYRGEIDRAGKRAFLRELDVLSVPAIYDEPKGMFLLEAMASGVPVVQPRRGAFIEVVNKTAAACSSIRTIPTRSRADCMRCGRIPPRASDSAARRYDGVRAHYTIAHSADRLIASLRIAHERCIASRIEGRRFKG